VSRRLPQSGSSSGPPVGLIVGAVLIAALATGGFVAASPQPGEVVTARPAS
jgi:hypothetical protein